MIFAQIRQGTVIGCIVIDDPQEVHTFSKGWDDFLQVDQITERPGPGWSYDRQKGEFSPPKAAPVLSAPAHAIDAFNLAIGQILSDRTPEELIKFCNDCSPIFDLIKLPVKNATATCLSTLINPILDEDFDPQNPGLTNRDHLINLIKIPDDKASVAAVPAFVIE